MKTDRMKTIVHLATAMTLMASLAKGALAAEPEIAKRVQVPRYSSNVDGVRFGFYMASEAAPTPERPNPKRQDCFDKQKAAVDQALAMPENAQYKKDPGLNLFLYELVDNSAGLLEPTRRTTFLPPQAEVGVNVAGRVFLRLRSSLDAGPKGEVIMCSIMDPAAITAQLKKALVENEPLKRVLGVNRTPPPQQSPAGGDGVDGSKLTLDAMLKRLSGKEAAPPSAPVKPEPAAPTK